MSICNQDGYNSPMAAPRKESHRSHKQSAPVVVPITGESKNNQSMQKPQQSHHHLVMTCEPSKFCVNVACVLTSWVKPWIGEIPKAMLNFSTYIPLGVWVGTIQSIGNLDDLNMIYGLALLKRILNRRQDLPFTYLNVHRLYLVSVIVATKFLDDITYKNKDWSTIGGRWFSLHEINTMELEFLLALDYSLHVSVDEISEALEGTHLHEMVFNRTQGGFMSSVIPTQIQRSDDVDQSAEQTGETKDLKNQSESSLTLGLFSEGATQVQQQSDITYSGNDIQAN
ncbi:MAG: hypothetical protein EZS28_004815 [Streblomastix strix]|uniref:Cyclin N-terminal domain-containing protein n=1 Tax=Streblomastix strix TaxID=222440 RepID=A0A5J4WZ96_9EUKA|nr:MAG: hypothetical protein EZS28_004815 [Streblomastix strix]